MFFKNSNFSKYFNHGSKINNLLLFSNSIARFLEMLNNLYNTFLKLFSCQLFRVFVRFGCKWKRFYFQLVIQLSEKIFCFPIFEIIIKSIGGIKLFSLFFIFWIDRPFTLILSIFLFWTCLILFFLLLIKLIFILTLHLIFFNFIFSLLRL